MNNQVIVNAAVFVLVCCIVACSPQSELQLTENAGKTHAYAIRVDRNGLLDILVYDTLNMGEINVVPTMASAVHRYGSRWISESCILLESSDIGCRVVDVSDRCQIYLAKKERDGDGMKVVLYDETWSPVGREIRIQ